MIVRSEQHEEDSLANERWLRSCCGVDEPAMLVNSDVLGGDQGVDGEEYRDVAVQLQDSSLQIHHQGPQGRKDVVHVCAHSEERSDRDAGERGSSTTPCGSTRRADQSISTCASASRSARPPRGTAPSSDGRCGERSAAAELCSKEVRRDCSPEAEAGRRLPRRGGADQFSGPQGLRAPTRGVSEQLRGQDRARGATYSPVR